ncbi:aldose epimerase family protein [Rhodospirillum sp. A1_3_36]|uniref:aldose epimerase family protein n=1 Tax=Rhodospirillum sp. A1_3_36 TaxID=3391666 RepID=UPI0039A7483A
MMNRFGTLPTGEFVERVEICAHGLTARFLTLGAILQDLRLEGVSHPLTLGFERLEDYLLHPDLYFGAMVGRYANRIGGARAAVGGQVVALDANFRGRHLLHGGAEGSSRRMWRILSLAEDRVTFGDRLPDGHMGFPGNLDVQVTFQITSDSIMGEAIPPSPRLHIHVRAETDGETLCNFAHHSYFNLSGRPSIAGHRLRIAADSYLPVDRDLIPTGERRAVEGTPFDLRGGLTLTSEGRAQGFDHNFCLSGGRCPIRPVAWLEAPDDDPAMVVETTEPGLQFYDGAMIAATALGLEGRSLGAHAGLALEPQLWPDAPNHPAFPSALLRPGEVYEQHTALVLSRRGPTEGPL